MGKKSNSTTKTNEPKNNESSISNSKMCRCWPDAPEWTGPLIANEKLTKGQRLLEGEARAPESITISDQGKLYTGLSDGRLIEVQNDVISREWRLKTVQSGTVCDGSYDSEPLCGRPLGVRYRDGLVYVVEPYSGLYTLDVNTGTISQLFKAPVLVNNRPSMFLNDLDFLDEDNVVISDSSTTYTRRDVLAGMVMQAQPSGRILQFNLKTKDLKVLSDQLNFPNGIIVLKGGKELLVAETGMARILRISLTGPNQGERTVFSENLPGVPDNIRLANDGNVWVPLAGVRHPTFSIMDFLGARPWIRDLVLKIATARQLEQVSHLVQDTHGLLLKVDMRGRIIDSWHDAKGGTIPSVTHVAEHKGHLYIGSYWAPFLGKVTA